MQIKNNDLLVTNHNAITQIICSILLLIVICLFDELHHFGVWSDFLCGAIGVFIAWKGYRIVSNKNAPPHSEPSWFGFPLTLRSTSPVGRLELLTYLEQEKVGTRLLFAGNLVRQPYMAGKNYRVSNELTHTDRVMNDTFWIGLQPALTQDMLTYSASKIASYLGAEI